MAPHSEPTLFYICMGGTEHVVHRCPVGLVFNEHVGRCDYDDAQPDVNQQCTANLCLNGGLCEVVDNGPRCMCPLGFSGEFCQTNTDDCGEENKCGAKGRCVDLIDGYVCLCENEYYGIDCDANSNSNNYFSGKFKFLIEKILSD